MLKEKTIEFNVNSLIGFKLAAGGGEEIIGKLVSINDTEVVVQHAHHIVQNGPAAPGERPQMAFAPYMIMSGPNVLFYRKDICAMFAPESGFIQAYIKATSDSTIVVPKKQSIIV